jgi:hypothetical protein
MSMQKAARQAIATIVQICLAPVLGPPTADGEVE